MQTQRWYTVYVVNQFLTIAILDKAGDKNKAHGQHMQLVTILVQISSQQRRMSHKSDSAR